MQPRLATNLLFSCLHLLSAGITGVHHHTQLRNNNFRARQRTGALCTYLMVDLAGPLQLEFLGAMHTDNASLVFTLLEVGA
jgi:hypothetical protein